jgi:CheY-like chemotaxis protein
MTTVLVVEDEFAVLAVLALTLEAEGYAVRRASHGREALALLRAERFDAVLCDEMMPLLGGAGLAAEARKLPGYEAIPIVLMAEVPRAAPAGVSAVVTKPLRAVALVDALKRLGVEA